MNILSYIDDLVSLYQNEATTSTNIGIVIELHSARLSGLAALLSDSPNDFHNELSQFVKDPVKGLTIEYTLTGVISNIEIKNNSRNIIKLDIQPLALLKFNSSHIISF